jgi:hypothetical protein
MIDEEIKKTKSNKTSPYTSNTLATECGPLDDSMDKLAELNLRNTAAPKQRTPTRPPIPIRSGIKSGTSLPGDYVSGFFSHSMPIRPVIGSLPGPAMTDMPNLSLPPSSSINSPPGIMPLTSLKDEQGEFMPRSLIKHHDDYHIPVKKSFKYAVSCPSAIANFPMEVMKKIADAEKDG